MFLVGDKIQIYPELRSYWRFICKYGKRSWLQTWDILGMEVSIFLYQSALWKHSQVAHSNIIHKTLCDWYLILWTYCLHAFQSLGLSFWHCFEQFHFTRRPPDALNWSSCGAKSDTLTAVWHFCQLRPKGVLRVNSTQQEPHKWVNHARYGMSCRYESELTSLCEDTNIT